MSAQSEALAKIKTAQGKGAAAAKGAGAELDPYCRLKVYPQRRQQLTIAFGTLFVLFISILTQYAYSGSAEWLVPCLPIMGLGLMIVLVPSTEEWEYTPWQARARQYERHFTVR